MPRKKADTPAETPTETKRLLLTVKVGDSVNWHMDCSEHHKHPAAVLKAEGDCLELLILATRERKASVFHEDNPKLENKNIRRYGCWSLPPQYAAQLQMKADILEVKADIEDLKRHNATLATTRGDAK